MSEPIKRGQSVKAFQEGLAEFLKQFDAYTHSIDLRGFRANGIITIEIKRIEPNEINET